MDKPRKLQEIFDVVLDYELYQRNGYMCNALHNAKRADLITEDERDLALGAIENYIGEKYCLINAIGHLPKYSKDAYERYYLWVPRVGVPFYRNWAKRPKLKRK